MEVTDRYVLPFRTHNWKIIGIKHAEQRFPLLRGTNGGVFGHLRQLSRLLPDGSPYKGEPGIAKSL